MTKFYMDMWNYFHLTYTLMEDLPLPKYLAYVCIMQHYKKEKIINDRLFCIKCNPLELVVSIYIFFLINTEYTYMYIIS